jgi:hypothetical protein
MRNIREKIAVKEGELIDSSFQTAEGKQVSELYGMNFDSAFMKPLFKVFYFNRRKYYGAENKFKQRAFVCRSEYSTGNFQMLCRECLTDGNAFISGVKTANFYDFMAGNQNINFFEFDTFKELTDWLTEKA